MTAVTGMDIVREARTWLDVRWRHQGRNRQGVDCIGLPVCVRAGLGLETIDVTDYSRTSTDESMLVYCRQYMREVQALLPGDVAVMAFDNQRHMAIVGNYPVDGEVSIIHAGAFWRRVIEHRLDSVWQRRIIGRFRFPEVIACS